MAKNKNIFNGKEYEITSFLSIQDKGSLVTDIADAVFSDGVYAPYMLDIAYALDCVAYYTNAEFPTIETDDGKVKIDVDKAYELIKTSRVMDNIDRVIDSDIYGNAQELIEFRKEAFLKNSKLDELADAFTGFIGTLDSAAKNDLKDIDIKELLNAAKSVGSKDEAKLAQGILDFQKEKTKKENK